jgi:GTP cyclohydrolase I
MAGQPKPANSVRFDVAAMRDAIRQFLEAAGLEVEGTDIEATPDRVARSWIESYLDGYEADAATILKDAYENERPGDASEMVLLKDIPFQGMCPHHLLPFHGRAHVAYVPGKKLASLSSLARLVDCYAHRLDIQESVTRNIADAMTRYLDAAGAAVVLDTDQTCMTTRGVSREGTHTVTQHFTGAFADDSTLRSELLSSIA